MYHDLMTYIEAERVIKYLEFKSQHDQSVMDELNALKEKRDKLNKIIYSLSDIYRDIIIAKYFEGKPLIEIAQDTKYSYAHIKRIHAHMINVIKELGPYIKY